jgi:hypothetical protein
VKDAAEASILRRQYLFNPLKLIMFGYFYNSDAIVQGPILPNSFSAENCSN